jgi:hypothetical protein
MNNFNHSAYARTAGVPGVATNASWVGPWVRVPKAGGIGFQVVMTGTGAPVGTWGADITDDDGDPNGATFTAVLGATPLTLTAAMTAQNPIGDSANINFLFDFNPAPSAKWIRFKYTRSAAGSATATVLKVGVSGATTGGN